VEAQAFSVAREWKKRRILLCTHISEPHTDVTQQKEQSTIEVHRYFGEGHSWCSSTAHKTTLGHSNACTMRCRPSYQQAAFQTIGPILSIICFPVWLWRNPHQDQPWRIGWWRLYLERCGTRKQIFHSPRCWRTAVNQWPFLLPAQHRDMSMPSTFYARVAPNLWEKHQTCTKIR